MNTRRKAKTMDLLIQATKQGKTAVWRHGCLRFIDNDADRGSHGTHACRLRPCVKAPKKASAAAGGSGAAKARLWLCEAYLEEMVFGESEPQLGGTAYASVRFVPGSGSSASDGRAALPAVSTTAQNGGMARQYESSMFPCEGQAVSVCVHRIKVN